MKLINPTLNKNEIRVPNSTTFISEAKQWNIHPTEVQVSFDAVNLYPSIPIKKATIIILEMISDDFDDFSSRTKLNINDIKTLIDLMKYIGPYK